MRGGDSRRRPAVVGEAQAQRQHGDRDHQHHNQRDAAGQPGPLLQPVAVPGEGARAVRVWRLPTSDDLR